jgi:hypothetical protein
MESRMRGKVGPGAVCTRACAFVALYVYVFSRVFPHPSVRATTLVPVSVSVDVVFFSLCECVYVICPRLCLHAGVLRSF